MRLLLLLILVAIVAGVFGCKGEPQREPTYRHDWESETVKPD